MDILACQKDNEGMICQKCGGFINIYDQLIGIKDQLEIINKSNNITIDKIKTQLNNIMILIDNMLPQIKKKDINDNNKIKKKYDNIVTGIIDINENNKNILLCKSNQKINIFINDEKINIINKDNNKYMYKFN